MAFFCMYFSGCVIIRIVREGVSEEEAAPVSVILHFDESAGVFGVKRVKYL